MTASKARNAQALWPHFYTSGQSKSLPSLGYPISVIIGYSGCDPETGERLLSTRIPKSCRGDAVTVGGRHDDRRYELSVGWQAC